MIVDHLNTYVAGGAARAAIQLHQSLLDARIDSRFWYSRSHDHVVPPKSNHIKWRAARRNKLATWIGDALTAGNKLRLKRQVRRNFSGRSACTEVFTLPLEAAPTRFDSQQMNGDVLHLHWVGYMLDYPSFFDSIPDGHPLVWTMHDVNLVTGGCHYMGECQAFERECQHCPQLVRPGARDLSQRSFQVKLRALENKNLHVVANSRWTEDVARRSRILRTAKSIRTIHYGVDSAQFRPVEKEVARQRLGLPVGASIVAFGAHDVTVRRKGLTELLEALGRIRSNRDVLAIAFGGGKLPSDKVGDCLIRHVGRIDSVRTLSEVYSAADVFVIPSLEEAFGQTGLEALACETPVVGFRTGGIPDFVRPGKTGLLANPADIADLSRQINWMLTHPNEARSLGSNGRQMVVDEFDPDRQAAKYVGLYESLTQHRVKNRDTVAA